MAENLKEQQDLLFDEMTKSKDGELSEFGKAFLEAFQAFNKLQEADRVYRREYLKAFLEATEPKETAE